MLTLREILDRIEFEGLLMEGRDPVEVLHYKYKNVPSSVIDEVIKIDPTKKKSYSQWVLSKWDDEKGVIVKALKSGRLKKLFDHYKHHDDVQIKDCPSVLEGLRMFVPVEDTVLTKSDEPMTYVENLGREVDSDLANDFDIVYEDDRWLIAVPNTYEAECKLGENMKWCTANAFGNGESFYDRYLSSGGKYYVNFDKTQGENRNGKDYPYKRYQFHFETKQFMDKDDEPVSLDEIGIPEDAIKFYEEEGYDRSDFEDLEAKMERYDEWRYNNTYYRLNDDLSLSIAYDDNYEPVDVNENTDFYVFDDNDERDPISWVEVPNPFVHDDVVVLNKEDYIILKKLGYDDELLAVVNEHNKANRGYRVWETYEISNYMELPDDVGLFGVIIHGDGIKSYGMLTSYGENLYQKLRIDECEGMFINKYCTEADAESWGRIFIECVSDGYHSLFTVDIDGTNGHSLECLIKKDKPKDGNQYIIENGVIYGLYGRYNAYNDGTGNGEGFTKYVFEDELDNGNYIVSYTFGEGDEAKDMENVLVKGSKEPLLTDWVDKVLGLESNLYITKKDNRVGIFGFDGHLIGQWYNVHGVLDKELGVIVGQVRSENGDQVQSDFISGKDGSIFASFKMLLTNYQANHNILVLPFDSEEPVSYNYETRQYSHQEIETYRKIGRYNDKNFLCKMRDGDSYVIYNFKDQQVIADGIAKLEPLRSCSFYKVDKLDGKVNLFDYATSLMLIPYDVDEISDVAEYRNVVMFALNNRTYLYDFRYNKMIGNPLGVELKGYIDGSGYYVYSDGTYNLRFCADGNKLRYREWYNANNPRGGGYGYKFDSNTPQEVINICNKVTGGNVQPQRDAVSESFKRFMGRMDNASKVLHENKLVR